MTVIAMTREMGSRGKDVAAALAEELGLRIVRHELVDHVAERMHAANSSVDRFLEGSANILERWDIDKDDLLLRTKEEILDLAAGGNVLFRGWGATHVLMKVPHALCVRVCAPMDSRKRELMARTGMHKSSIAENEIRKNDDAHSRVLSRLFHADWDEATGYDAVLNLERMSVPSCVALITQLASQPEFSQTEASTRVLCHLRTEARIRAMLYEANVESRAAPSFEVELDAETGIATMRGVVFDENFRAEAVALVRGVDGVSEVIDEVFVPATMTYIP
jgi:cytidylate kinase